jgi:hypothetical protein
VTPEGKARSSQNAIRHGIFQSEVAAIQVGPLRESPQEFRELADAVHAELAPQTPLEAERVDDIISLLWRLRRLRRWEVAGLEGLLVAGDTGGWTVNQYQADVLRLGASVLRRIEDSDLTADELRCAAIAIDYKTSTPVPGWAAPSLEPTTADGWRDVLGHLLTAARWESFDEALEWVENEAEMRQGLVDEKLEPLRPLAVRQAVTDGFFQQILRYDGPIERRLTKALSDYWAMQARREAMVS